MLNQARLKVLKVREDHVRSVLEEARKRLGEVTSDTFRYKGILQQLILQALYQVRCYVRERVGKREKTHENIKTQVDDSSLNHVTVKSHVVKLCFSAVGKIWSEWSILITKYYTCVHKKYFMLSTLNYTRGIWEFNDEYALR